MIRDSMTFLIHWEDITSEKVRNDQQKGYEISREEVCGKQSFRG